jgi:ribokinase
MERGRFYGALTLLNPAPGQPVFDSDQLAHVDLLTPNETEARILLGLEPDDPTPTADLARRLLDLGVRQVVVTLGAKGALIASAGLMEQVSAPKIEALDVTGAGDSFNAALAVGLGEGLELRDAVEWATYAGAYCATHLGVIDGLPTREQLDAFRHSVAGAW